MTATVDVAIVGGGLVGASLALALKDSGKSVVLIEAAAPPASPPSWDERTIALNVASQRIYSALGLWPALEPELAPITSTHISEKGCFGVARFAAEEAGEAALGWNVPVRHLGAVLWERVRGLPNVSVRCPAKVAGVGTAGDAVTLSVIPANAAAELSSLAGTRFAAGIQSSNAERLDPRVRGGDGASGGGGARADNGDGGRDELGQESEIRARLVVACDGANSAVRKALGIGAQEIDYAQVAIVGALKPERPHKGVAYERFLPEGPIAVLPKPGRDCALVWTVAKDSAPKLLALDDADFLAAAHEAFGHRLGKFLAAGRRNGYPLTRTMSDAITAPRVILAGNAAQALHPIAAQGFNLGLRDVATVAEIAGSAADPGSPAMLAEYESRRRGERETVAGFTDRLVRIFSNSTPGLAQARHWGLLALDLIPGVKQGVMRQNLGFAGGTPALAREKA